MPWTAPMTATAGSIYTAAQFNTYTRDNTLELRATPANRCVAYHNATQTVNSGNTDALNLNSEVYDTATMHDLVTNNSRITIPSGGAGVYLFFGSTHVENAAATPTATLHLRISGTIIRSRRVVTDPAIGMRQQPIDVYAFHTLGAGDYAELVGQAGSANVTFGSATAEQATRLEVIGPLPPS